MRRRIPNPLFPPGDPEQAGGDARGADNPAQNDECVEDDEEDEEDVCKEEEEEEEEDSNDTALELAKKQYLKDLEERMYSKVAQDLLKLPKPGSLPVISSKNKTKAKSTDVSNNTARKSSR